ncbi:MAG: fumarylacetoacetate hydrolase family protein [Blastomonas sp.]
MTPVSFFVKGSVTGEFKEGIAVTAEAREIANAFVEARRSGTSIARYPGERPADLATAYEIQDCALAVWNREIGGWKVGKINPPDDSRLGTNRLAGPAFSDLIFLAGPETRRFTTFSGGFAAAEAEFMLRLAPQQGPLPCNADEARSWVDEIRIGIEIAASPYPGINADGPCVTISDHGNNAGLLLGPQVPKDKWSALNDIEVMLDIDGQTVGRDSTANMLDGPFGAVRFLLGNLAGRGIVPRPGWWISSGAITGVHEIRPGDEVVARFEGVGTVSASIA